MNTYRSTLGLSRSLTASYKASLMHRKSRTSVRHRVLSLSLSLSVSQWSAVHTCPVAHVLPHAGKKGGESRCRCWLITGLSRSQRTQRLGFLLSATLATVAICRESKAAHEQERHNAGRFGGRARTECATLAAKCEDHVKASDCLATSMSGVHHGVSDDVLEEDLSGGRSVRRKEGQGGGDSGRLVTLSTPRVSS